MLKKYREIIYLFKNCNTTRERPPWHGKYIGFIVLDSEARIKNTNAIANRELATYRKRRFKAILPR